MTYDPTVHHRRSIRLRGHDYSQGGMYFVTICCHDRQALFGEIVDGDMVLNKAGQAVVDSWDWLSKQHEHVRLNEFVIMPNHVHAIIEVVGAQCPAKNVGAQFIAPVFSAPDQGAMNRAPTVGMLVRAFKARCTRAINGLWQTSGIPVWQRNYYEHIIRNEDAYLKIAEYVQTNPQRWKDDTYYIE